MGLSEFRLASDNWSPHTDLDRVAAAHGEIWNRLQGSNILMTGATGTIGKWILEAILHANLRFGLNISVTVLSRDPQKAKGLVSNLQSSQHIKYIKGDIKNLQLPSYQVSYVIHGAAPTSDQAENLDQIEIFNAIVSGTKNLLEMTKTADTPRFLFLSSGAVYGPQPNDVLLEDESQMTAPDTTDPSYVYGEAKRAAEMLCSVYSSEFGIQPTIARIFAVVGPGMPLNKHFAIGNFISDYLCGRKIEILGTGKPIRSYLYLADVAYWLLKLLIDGAVGSAYNVGSEHALSLLDLAELVNTTLDVRGVVARGQAEKGPNPGRYVPSTAKARDELGLRESFTLQESIVRTAEWYRSIYT